MTDSGHVKMHVATNGDDMRNATCLEFTYLDIAHFDRMVDQFRIVVRRKCTCQLELMGTPRNFR